MSNRNIIIAVATVLGFAAIFVCCVCFHHRRSLTRKPRPGGAVNAGFKRSATLVTGIPVSPGSMEASKPLLAPQTPTSPPPRDLPAAAATAPLSSPDTDVSIDDGLAASRPRISTADMSVHEVAVPEASTDGVRVQIPIIDEEEVRRLRHR